jgi:hypothetical protein
MAAPKREHILCNRLQVRFASIGIYSDQRVPAIREANAIEAGARQRERLRLGSFCERQSAAAIRINDFDTRGWIARRRRS